MVPRKCSNGKEVYVVFCFKYYRGDSDGINLVDKKVIVIVKLYGVIYKLKWVIYYNKLL